jgi:hypothetical protein
MTTKIGVAARSGFVLTSWDPFFTRKKRQRRVRSFFKKEPRDQSLGGI